MAAWEAGFTVPPAGQDAQWAKENMEAFKAKARDGDEDFANLVEELSGKAGFQ